MKEHEWYSRREWAQRGPSWEEICLSHFKGDFEEEECVGYRFGLCQFPLSRHLEYEESECPGPNHRLILMAQRVTKGEPAHG